MKNLFDIFGYCHIPRGTLLFHGHESDEIEDYMFFATKPWVAGVFNDSIQVWKTTRDMQVLFLIDHVDRNSWTGCSLLQLDNGVFVYGTSSVIQSTGIRDWDEDRRTSLFAKLKEEFNITGWLTSIEDKVELEVCLWGLGEENRRIAFVELFVLNG